MTVLIKRGGWGKFSKGQEVRVPLSVGRVMCKQGYAEELKGPRDKSAAPRKRRKKAEPAPE